MLNPPAETVNHHLTRAGEFSTGRMRNFQPELTDHRLALLHRTALLTFQHEIPSLQW
jgi:hypothetical protein